MHRGHRAVHPDRQRRAGATGAASSLAPPTLAPMGSHRAIWLAAAALVASTCLLACSAAADDPTEGEGREAAVYGAILGWILDADPPLAGDDGRPPWTMFVASRHERPIGVDVQVLVVDALDERVVVRFIDDRTEAVDDSTELRAVREDGMLVGLGAVPAEGDRVDVYADRYRDTGDVAAWQVTVERSGNVWRVIGEPEAVDVRPLPAED